MAILCDSVKFTDKFAFNCNGLLPLHLQAGMGSSAQSDLQDENRRLQEQVRGPGTGNGETSAVPSLVGQYRTSC